MTRGHYSKTITLVGTLLAGVTGGSWIVPPSATASVCDAAAFSCPPAGTCIITAGYDIGDGCTLDFGSGAVEIRSTLRAGSVGGSFEVDAGSLTLNGGQLMTTGSSVASGGDITVAVLGAFSMFGSGAKIDVSGIAGGGDVSVTAGSVSMASGLVNTQGGSGDGCGDAGDITLNAKSGALSVGGTLRATTPGHDCEGGDISMTGQSVVVSGIVDAHGGARASEDAISIEATNGDLQVTSAASLVADGTGGDDGADGGGISFEADLGGVTLLGPLSSRGNAPTGNGGALTIFARDTITLAGSVILTGESSGAGGQVQINGVGSVNVSGAINAGGGASSVGGLGGDVQIRTTGPLTISSTLTTLGANGGDLYLQGYPLSMSGHLSAHGSRIHGGRVELDSCRIDVSGTIDGGASNGGDGGAIVMKGGATFVDGGASVSVIPCVSQNCVNISTASGTANIDGQATVTPAPVVVQDSTLPLC